MRGVICRENRRIHVVNCQWLYDTVRFWEVKDAGEASACRRHAHLPISDGGRSQASPVGDMVQLAAPALLVETCLAKFGLLSLMHPASCQGTMPACNMPGSHFCSQSVAGFCLQGAMTGPATTTLQHRGPLLGPSRRLP